MRPPGTDIEPVRKERRLTLPADEALPEGCRLLLRHSDWEAFGTQLGRELRAGYEPGWDVVLAPFEALAS